MVSIAIWDHTVLPATRHKRTHTALTPASEGWYSIYLPWRDGRLRWPRWMVTCYITRPQTVTHPCINRARRRLTTLIRDQCATTKPGHHLLRKHWTTGILSNMTETGDIQTGIVSTSSSINTPPPASFKQHSLPLHPSRLVIRQTVWTEVTDVQPLEVVHEVSERNPADHTAWPPNMTTHCQHTNI